MSYRHLTLEQRYQIPPLHGAGFSQKDIAESIGCHPSTVSRELQHNRRGKTYVDWVAHGHARQRRHAANGCAHLSEAMQRELEGTAQSRVDQRSPGFAQSRSSKLRPAPAALPIAVRSMIVLRKSPRAVAWAIGEPTKIRLHFKVESARPR